jgi:hypothetical protein
MIACAAPADDPGERGLRRGAPLPRLPSLKTDNCIRTSRRKQLFVAQENIRLYIEKFGKNNVAVLTITTPSECLSASDFQAKWRSFRTNVIVRMFPTGMWVRERQPRTGNWHSHAVVDLGWDVRTGFPFDEVKRGLYANVQLRLRKVWKQLREKSKSHGFGRTELLPIKHGGNGCARYLTKYLSKAFVSEKILGEEKRRLFGIWGGVRFIHSHFDWVTNRILRKKKEWLAKTACLKDAEGFSALYGPRWWFVIGEALMKVVLPIEYYQVKRDNVHEWDDLGWFAYQADVGRYPDLASDDARRRQSLFDFYSAEGAAFGYSAGQAARYAMNRIGYLERDGRELDPQIFLDMEGTIERGKGTVRSSV